MEERVSFDSEGHKIIGDFNLLRRGAPCVIMSHGLESTKDGRKWVALARNLDAAGIGYLRFNYRGCGEGDDRSDGAFEDMTLTARIADFRAAIDFVETMGVDRNRIGAVGSSFGGMVVLAAGDARLKAMVAIATPAGPPKGLSGVGRQVGRPSAQPQGGMVEMPSGRKLRLAYFQDVACYDLCQAASNLARPLLIIHGSDDELVAVDDARALHASAKPPKQIAIIPGGDHQLAGPDHLWQVVQLTIGWFKRYL